MSGAPIELVGFDDPYPGVIRARREGEPSFTYVQDIYDAELAAQSRGVQVVIPKWLVDRLREAGDLATEDDLPWWIEVRHHL